MLLTCGLDTGCPTASAKLKKPSHMIDAFITHCIWSGEFNSDEASAITCILNVQVCATCGENPVQNGLCERLHVHNITEYDAVQT